MTQEAFLVNPPRRRRGFFGNAPKKKGKRRKLYGAAAAAHAKRVGGGTRKRKKAVTTGAVRRRRKHFSYAKAKRHQVVVYRTSPKRWSRSPRSKSRRRGIKINPYMTVAGANPRHYRRYRRNPARMGGPFDLMKNMPYVFTGALSATAQAVVPPMMPATFQTPLMRFGVQAAVAVGGGMLVNQMVRDKTHGTVWMITGGAIILADVIKTYVLPMIPGLSDYTVSDYEVSGEGEAEMLEAFPTDVFSGDVSEFSAFPNRAVAY